SPTASPPPVPSLPPPTPFSPRQRPPRRSQLHHIPRSPRQLRTVDLIPIAQHGHLTRRIRTIVPSAKRQHPGHFPRMARWNEANHHAFMKFPRLQDLSRNRKVSHRFRLLRPVSVRAFSGKLHRPPLKILLNVHPGRHADRLFRILCVLCTKNLANPLHVFWLTKENRPVARLRFTDEGRRFTQLPPGGNRVFSGSCK